MRVPASLADAFKTGFQEIVSDFAAAKGLLPEPGALASERFLARSVIPHVEKLSALFNREESSQEAGLGPYWQQSSNPANLRLAYFLYFMPSNLFRSASVWAELARLGYRWPEGESLRAIEFGAGPASGACGILAGESHAPVGLPRAGSWALIEQDKAMLKLGTEWAEHYFSTAEAFDWGVRPFHRRIELGRGFLPRSAPKFNLWLMSFTLNEFTESPGELAEALLDSWERHLAEEGLAIFVEPALRLQSRRLLELRRELLARASKRGLDWLKLLVPCLGHQACGALAEPDDWCHEEVMWWRPPYFRIIDQMAGLDRKSLPFSYLVFARTRRSREELLPEAMAGAADRRYRLVSPAHSEGQDLEFFVCGQEGKRRARKRPDEGEEDLGRGDILTDTTIRGDTHASRIERARRVTR